MDSRINEWIKFTKGKFGLDQYVLQRYSLDRHVNLLNETIYILCMEWFPNHVTEQEDDGSNPDGTAVIDIDVNSGNVESIIFVGGKSYANGISFSNFTKKDIIHWIEVETKLTYEEQFELHEEEERELHFKACMEGIAVSPSGSIEIGFDQQGKLTMFSVQGHFPVKEMVEKETYSLSLEMIEHVTMEQLKLLEIPSYEKEQVFLVYGLEEVYLLNDRTSTIPFAFSEEIYSHLKVDHTMHWDTPIQESFEQKEICLMENITVEQAFSKESSPDTLPISMVEQEKCVVTVMDFLQKVYPHDTGKWLLKTIHRDKGYMHATLRESKQKYHVFKRKITVIMDGKNFQVLNYIDNKPFLDLFAHFQKAGEATITKDKAYEKLKNYLKLDPYYVYDMERRRYILCGKLDCHYGVNAGNGEVIALDDL